MIEKKNENRGIGVKWNTWDALESSFPCYYVRNSDLLTLDSCIW